MRQYEAVYILDPSLEEAQQTALVERFTALVEGQGGTIQHVDRWERRRLAYEVKGRREGYYVVMNFQGSAAAEAELMRVFGITDDVIRHMIVKMDERVAQKAINEAKSAAEAKARADAEARAAAEAAAAAQPATPEAAPETPEAAPAAADAAPATTGDAPAASEGTVGENTQDTAQTETGTVAEDTGTEA